ncbi:MAG: hypothetical protein ABL916_24330 [Burkholderiaceae bacterium]
MLTAIEFEVLSNLNERREATGRGRKTQVVDEAAALLGCSRNTAYNKLKAAGFAAPRKRHSTAGKSAMTTAERQLTAGVLLASTNKKGQHMPVNTAVEILRAGGHLPSGLSPASVLRQLHAHNMTPKDFAAPTASVQLSSLHPGHVSQSDSTTGAYYYLPGGRLRWMPEDEFYKNKVTNLVKASSDLLTRYAYVDHTSHAFKLRYYLGGETAENLIDFITWAWWKQTDSPMHGLPQILMMDPGAANKGLLMRNLCRRVGVQLIHHAPGAARVTGSVEKVHDLVRMHFESRLRFVDPKDVTLDRLNEEISAWAATYCSNSVHSRHERTRYAAWMDIKPEHLRIAASLEVLREAAHADPVTPRVSNDMTVPFKGKHYDVALVPGASPARKLTVVQNVFRAPAIDVLYVDPSTGEETWHVVEPLQTNEWGYGENSTVLGQDMRTARNTHVDDMRNTLTKGAYQRPGDKLPTLEEAAKARKQHAQAYAGVVDVMADVKATPVPAYLPRRGTAMDAPPVRNVVTKTLSTVEACMRMRKHLGADYPRETYAWVEAKFPEGVPEDQIANICAQISRVDDATTQASAASALLGGLRVVGDGQ